MGKRKLPDVLTDDEQKALLTAFNLRYHNGRKNRLIVETMLTAGLRVSEVCNLRWSNLRWREGSLTVRDGKGGKDRVLYLPATLVARLKAYRDEAPNSAYVFATRSGNPSDRSTVTKMIKTYAAKAGIEKRVYAHLLRHTALTDLYRKENDIRLVQTVAGHSSIQTTQIYTHIAPEEIRDAMTREKY